MYIDLRITFDRADTVDEANYRRIAAVVAKWAVERRFRAGAQIEVGENHVRVRDAGINDADFRFLLTCIHKMQDYPLLDGADHAAVEYEFAHIVWGRMSIEDRVRWIQRHAAREVSVFAARRNEIPPCTAGDEYALLADEYRQD